MYYIVSDLHGDLIGFKKLLDKLSFNKNKDKMLILGDVLDRGPDGVELLYYIKELCEYGCAELLLGNHELFCIMYLEGKLNAAKWSAFGGDETLNALKEMTAAEQENLKNYLKSLPLYMEIKSFFIGPNVTCTHSGIHGDYLIRDREGFIDVKSSIEEAYSKAPYELMCGTDIHYLSRSDLNALDSYLIVGHVPCNRLNDDENDNSIFRTKYYMDIDAGNGFEGGKIACYVVETDEEIYI